MGTYATTTHLDLVMVGVNFSATDQTTLASKAIDHAEAEVNKYLSKRYDVSSFQNTSTSVPPIIRMLAEQLAEGYTWVWTSRGQEDLLKHGRGLIKEAKENLQAIADYKLDVLNTGGSVVTDLSNTAYSVRCNTSDYTPTFGEDSETAWSVDADKLDDLSDERD